MAVAATPYDALVPHVPRLLLGWLAESPDERLREIDGSMVFVDISGFTKMSEQLARKGKIGAEEVTDVISGVFARLLAVAYGNGGGLIKFGGDALLLFFFGEHHELRAARSAVGMRTTLRDIGPIRTSGGTVTLRMSVGVHSGPFLFFLVGESHRELIVTGPAASEVVRMESTANAGEIVVSEAVAAAIPSKVLGEPKGDGRLLRRVPPGLERYLGEYEYRIEGIELTDCIPVMLREVALAKHDEPEHRQATVAFVHYDGADSFVAEHGPAALTDALDELVTVVQRAVDANGITFLGSDIDHDGGKIILVAGVPQAVGDHDERMLLAARAIVDAGLTLPVRIGVNRGHVFAGEVGPLYRRTYTVMGDAVNLAARVMAQAQPGQVLATASVLDSSGIAFRAVPLEPFHVKGKTEPVVASDVGEPLGTSEGAALHDLPLVGRDQELGVLRDVTDAWRGGAGRVVEIVGPAGIGKTRLLSELCRLAGDVPVLAAVCDLYALATPYQPFRRVLERLLEIPPSADSAAAARILTARVHRDAPELEPWLPLLGLPLDLELPVTREVRELAEEFRRARLHETIVQLIARLSPSRFALTVEDVHWLDEASRGLLARIAAETVERPWLVGVTRREEETGFVAADGPSTVRIRPGPLGETDAELLIVAASEDAPFRPHELGVLAHRGGGNPLFLLELAQAARAAGTTEGLPTSVEGMVTAEIDRLPATLRRVLRRASVLGMVFSEELLDMLYEVDEERPGPALRSRLDGFFDRDDDGSWRFRHALVRDAAYEGLPFRRRRMLHARAADAIEQRSTESREEAAELLSLHFFHADRFPEAWRYSRVAGERAQAKWAHAAAAEFYERALAAAVHMPQVAPADVAAVYESLGRVRGKIGVYDGAVAAYQAARRRLRDDPVGQARLLQLEAEAAEDTGHFAKQLRLLGRARGLLDSISGDAASRERARLAVSTGACRLRQGRHGDGVRWCTRAAEEAGAIGDTSTVAWSYVVMDIAFIHLGDARAGTYGRLALAMYEELGDLPWQAAIVNNLGGLAYYENRWDEAVELYERARDLYRRYGDVTSYAEAEINLAEIRCAQGRYPEAEEALREATLIMRAAGRETIKAVAVAELGRVMYSSGRAREALPLLEQALGDFHAAHAEVETRETEVRICECLLARSDEEQALDAVESLVALVERSGEIATVRMPRLRRLQGLALARNGRAVEARQALESALSASRQEDAAYDLALTLEALVLLDLRLSDDSRVESEAIFERLGVVRTPTVLLLGKA